MKKPNRKKTEHWVVVDEQDNSILTGGSLEYCTKYAIAHETVFAKLVVEKRDN